ncbi:MAG: hypothetical protein K0Q91_583, partial [Fibrobacteria bacterium]|nr:hypothetical protein [Fibrobacteria bacterium]
MDSDCVRRFWNFKKSLKSRIIPHVLDESPRLFARFNLAEPQC